jgi:Polyketide cyclase / dehydrase and lipid transport
VSSMPASNIGSFHLDAPLDSVVPLFTALGERAWAKGWSPQILSGEEERGSAFVTCGHEGARVTWIVIEYQPAAGRVSYARLVQDSNIGLVDVTCEQAPSGGTDVAVRYTLTAVNDRGAEFVRHFLDKETYSAMIEDWRVSISKNLSSPDR